MRLILCPGIIYFYQTHFHNIHLKKARLVRRFLLRRRNRSSSKLYCCYIIISTELKGKHTLEQDELFCCLIISSGLKEKVSFVTKTKECRKRSLSFTSPERWTPFPPGEPCTPFSLRAPGSLSAYLRNVLGTLCLWFCGKLVPLGVQGILPQGVLQGTLKVWLGIWRLQ